MIYFDHNATTPIDERVLEAMLPFLSRFYGNPSSLYRLGRLARTAIDHAREQVAALAGIAPSQVVFTSGGTEANNLALTALSPGAALAVSAIEHPSIIEPALRLRQQGHGVELIPVDHDGVVTPDAIAGILERRPQLVSIMLANNETGVIQNMAEYAPRLRERGIVVHTDAVQAFGKIPFAFDDLGVQLMSLSGHKIHGPKGVGALLFERGVAVNPLLLGGGQERALRAGTENVAAIVGFGKAAELALAEMSERNRALLRLRACLERELAGIDGLTIFAQSAPRLPNTVQFGVAGSDGEMLLMQLDRQGIAVSSGSACASGGGTSPVLAAMGMPAELAKGAIRVSLGKTNTEAEITQFINVLKGLVGQA